MLDLIIKGGYVVFPNRFITRADIGVKDGKIVAIGDSLDRDKSAKVVDATGKYVCPGIIDSHFHIGIYRPFSEDAKSESRSAAAGGVTTILSYFRTGRNYLNTSGPYGEIFKKLLDLSRGNFYTDYGFNLSPITKIHINEIPELATTWGVTTFGEYYMFYKGLSLRGETMVNVVKEYLLSNDPYDLGHLYSVMLKIASLKENVPGIRLAIHAEDPEIIRFHVERVKEDMGRKGLNPLQAYSRARPPMAERLAIITAFELAHQTGCPIYILHVSSRLALDTVEEMRRLYPDVDVVVETTPHHLSLTEDSDAGVYAKVNPPIRSSDDREALWEGVRRGKIDVVASDHAALMASDKKGDLWTAESGFGGTELMLPILVTEGYIKRNIPLERLCALVTSNPAKAHALYGKKGDIALGFDADFVIFDPTKKRRVTYRELHSAQDFTPFEGLELYGWAEVTILRGNIVYENGKIIDPPIGEYIKRPIIR